MRLSVNLAPVGLDVVHSIVHRIQVHHQLSKFSNHIIRLFLLFPVHCATYRAREELGLGLTVYCIRSIV